MNKRRYYFKLAYPFSLPGRVQIRGDENGVWWTEDPKLAEKIAICHGTTAISSERIAALEALRGKGTRVGDDSDTGRLPSPAPVVSTLDPSEDEDEDAVDCEGCGDGTPATGQDDNGVPLCDGCLEESLVLCEAKDCDESVTRHDNGDPMSVCAKHAEGDEGSESDGEEAGSTISPDAPDPEPDGPEMVNDADIDAMTQADLRELLKEWGVEVPPEDVTIADLRAAAHGALPEPATDAGA
ncbi:hypothetical protein LCGC14_0273380 [marine sediment metagenome]|uniref:Uncharacterized protein n=2 Tax=root TaxID=1 RepID=A0A9C9NGS8_9HYPH|nr:hypothetical protein [Aurantimonas coralicida]